MAPSISSGAPITTRRRYGCEASCARDLSLQYGAGVGAGHVLVGAGNTVVDFAGMASTAALEEHARRLLHHAVRRDAQTIRMPVLWSGRHVSSGLVHDATDLQEPQAMSLQVEGVGTSFVLYFEVDGLLATAGATCESGALLLDKYTIEQDRFAGEDGGRHAAHFTFVARGLGVHHVRVHVADATLDWGMDGAGEREVARFPEAGT